jgi:hypothetical protein
VSRLGAVARAAGVGAAATYFFDPDMGRRRRALVRDQLVRLIRIGREEVEVGMRDASNRARGLVATVRQATDAPVADPLVAERVRACLGALDHPGGIDVEVTDGRAFLRGPVLAHDARRLRRLVRRVPGVGGVTDELEVHETPDVPALQGAPRRRGMGGLPPAARLAVPVVAAMGLGLLRVPRHVRPMTALRLGLVAALGAAVGTVERARQHATAGSQRAGLA